MVEWRKTPGSLTTASAGRESKRAGANAARREACAVEATASESMVPEAMYRFHVGVRLGTADLRPALAVDWFASYDLGMLFGPVRGVFHAVLVDYEYVLWQPATGG